MRKDVSFNIHPENYVVLDIETTGLSAKKNEIIELSALKVSKGEIIQEFTKLVKPLGYLSPFITNLTGINREMLSNAPYINEAIIEFKSFCSDSIVIGHNVTFDLNFINEKLFECHNITFDNDYIDTLKLARKLLPQLPSKKLGLIAAHFNLDTQGMHRGLKDCVVTNHCYQRLVKMLQQSDRILKSSVV